VAAAREPASRKSAATRARAPNRRTGGNPAAIRLSGVLSAVVITASRRKRVVWKGIKRVVRRVIKSAPGDVRVIRQDLRCILLRIPTGRGIGATGQDRSRNHQDHLGGSFHGASFNLWCRESLLQTPQSIGISLWPESPIATQTPGFSPKYLLTSNVVSLVLNAGNGSEHRHH
jgi:hypothetical protein